MQKGILCVCCVYPWEIGVKICTMSFGFSTTLRCFVSFLSYEYDPTKIQEAHSWNITRGINKQINK